MEFKDKKVAILGFGVEGRDVYNYIKNLGANIWICDRKEDIDKSGVDSSVQFILGENYLDRLKKFDIIFRSPGIPVLDKKIIEAKEAGVIVSSATKLFFELCPAKIIGVTGTKGKGTTVTLITEILKKSFEPVRKIWIGGNIGQQLLTELNNIGPDDWVVYELSSFQLQDLDKSPHIAVVLNITSDHLDIHETREEYVKAKRQIVSRQTEKDFAVINADYLTSFEYEAYTRGTVYFFSRKKMVDNGVYVSNNKFILSINNEEFEICDTSQLQLRGEHNWENIGAAILASYLAGCPTDIIIQVIKDFKGLEHRLEFVDEIDGVKYYNDSFATGPDPTIAAIRSFNEPIVLILGGRNKGLDFNELGRVISSSNVKTVILIGELANDLEKIIKKFDINNKIKLTKTGNSMEEIVKLAARESEKGDVLLLSPAAASFDMFLSYKDRGNQFKEQVKELKG